MLANQPTIELGGRRPSLYDDRGDLLTDEQRVWAEGRLFNLAVDVTHDKAGLARVNVSGVVPVACGLTCGFAANEDDLQAAVNGCFEALRRYVDERWQDQAAEGAAA